MIVEMENLRDILKSIDSYKLTEKEYGKQEYSSYLEGDDGTRCKICAGKGWLTPNVPTGHPDFGSIKACSCREEMREGNFFFRFGKIYFSTSSSTAQGTPLLNSQFILGGNKHYLLD